MSLFSSKNRELSFESLNQWQLVRLRFCKHKLAVVAFFILCALYLVAIFAGFFAPQSSWTNNLDYSYCPPHSISFSFAKGLHAKGMKAHTDPIVLRKTYVNDPSKDIPLTFFAKGEKYNILGFIPCSYHFFGVDRAELPFGFPEEDKVFYLLGADKYGRDILSRIINGSQVSLSVGLIGISITFVLGLTMGGISGYAGGNVDTVIQRVIEIINSFPRLPMWLALGAAVPGDWSPLKTYFAITICLSLLSWTGLARVVRGKILSLREEDYAVAANLLGASHARIIFRHLLPGFTSHIIVTLTLSIPGMILGETSLSFLGLGLRPPIVSWGVMLQDCMDIKAVTYYPWLMAPVVLIVATVLCFNFLGDGLRDAADPYS